MRVIGLCGRSGSGKGLFCGVAKEMGFCVIDCDGIYHSLVNAPSDCLYELDREFGSDFTAGGRLDRKRMAELVFSDPSALKKLNEITHHYVLIEVKKLIADDRNYIVDAPTLFESGFDACCDTVIAVIAPDAECIERICARDGVSAEEAQKRLSSQKSVDFLIENSDILLYNDSDPKSFEDSCRELLAGLSEGAL